MSSDNKGFALAVTMAALCLPLGVTIYRSMNRKEDQSGNPSASEKKEEKELKNKKYSSKDVITFSNPKDANAKESDKAFHLTGYVCKGFGRGSTELGFPTANLDIEKLIGKSKLDESVVGVYLGWAKLNNKVYPMVCSVGWNPTYQNEKKTIEAYIMQKFDKPFYGEEMDLLVCGYIRPELKFNSLEELIDAINNDVAIAKELLDTEHYLALRKTMSTDSSL